MEIKEIFILILKLILSMIKFQLFGKELKIFYNLQIILLQIKKQKLLGISKVIFQLNLLIIILIFNKINCG